MTKRPNPKVLVSISSRLLILCLLIILAFAVNIAIMNSASSNIEQVTNTIVSNDVDRILRNSQISRDLSEVLAGTHLLISTFYGNKEILESSRESLSSAIENVLNKEMGDALKSIVEEFGMSLDKLLHQCAAMNRKHASIIEIDKTLNVLLSDLEETVSLKIVELVLSGEDFRAFEQIGALIPSYRETLLKTILNFTKMSPILESDQDVRIITELLDNLHLRFRTLLASDRDVAAYGELLLEKVEYYREIVNYLQVDRLELIRLLHDFDDVKHESINALKELEDKSANAAQHMNDEISSITDTSIQSVMIISGSVAVFLGLFTYFFLLWHIKRPMNLIHKGINAVSEGEFGTKIQLGRRDEWNAIEIALNRMSDDLADSYNKLQKGNAELKSMYNEVEYNVQALEAEISLREEVEQALQVSEEQYRRFFQDDLSAAFIASRGGDIQLCNPAFVRMFGFPDINFSKHLTMRDLFPDSEKYNEFLVKLKKEKRLEYYESEYIRYDGSPLYAMGNITASFDEDNDIVELKGYLIDETKKRSAEKKSNQLEQQLQHSKKMEAIGTLAGGVAHDLNNILSGIVSYPDILLVDISDDSPYRKPISIIKESGKKAAAIVQDLLTLARRGVVVRNVTNLNSIVFEYLDSPDFKKMKSYYPGLDIEVNLAPDLYNIEGSPIHLMKTIMNLVSNGAESVRKEGIISIRTENRSITNLNQMQKGPEPGAYSVLTISDTGVGIPDDYLERIFEPFFTKKEMGRSGTGLGLAVVWGTVQDHSGYIDVISKEGQGTTFTLSFPKTDRQAPNDSQPLSLENYKGEGQSILVIDDDPTQRLIATKIISRLGYTVASVTSGEEAIDYLKVNSVDLLILDMIMVPGIDGLETYRRIQAFKPGQKAIITSGYSETGRVREVQRAGAARYLRKPYTLEEIGTAVKDVIKIQDGQSG